MRRVTACLRWEPRHPGARVWLQMRLPGTNELDSRPRPVLGHIGLGRYRDRMPSPRVLTKRSLNRALLERQLLLRRRRVPALEAVERLPAAPRAGAGAGEGLAALGSRVPRDPYVALWSRVEPFRAETLSDALEERRAVRMTLLRGTLHLVTARDAIGLRALVQPAIEGVIYGSSPLRTAVGSVDMDELFTSLRAWLEERPRTRAELVKEIAGRWPGAAADSLGYARA